MKYEPVFGDHEFANGTCEIAMKSQFGEIIEMTLTVPIVIPEGWAMIAMRRIIKTPVQHSDDVAVDLFAAKMKEKLEKSRDKGRSGWESCPIEHLIASLKDHISKGDPVDVANFAMMISQRGESIKTPVWTETDRRSKKLPPVGDQCLFYRPLAENSGDDVIAVKTAMKNAQYCWPNTVPGWEEPCNPSNGDCHVTHWMPLPAPPEQDK